MAEKQDITILGWIKRIGELRDGFLVGVGILYIVGYTVWAYNAWRNNIGLIPPLDIQYFVAGIVPTLYLVGLYFAIRISFLFRERVQSYLAPGVTGLKLILRSVIFIIFGILTLGMLASTFFMETFPDVAKTLLYIFIVTSFFLPPVQNVPQTFETAKNTDDNKSKSSFEDYYFHDSLKGLFPDTKFFRFLTKIVYIIIAIFIIVLIGYLDKYLHEYFFWALASFIIIFISKSFYKKWLTFFSDSRFYRLLGTLLCAIVFILGLIIVYYLREYIFLAFGYFIIFLLMISARGLIVELYRYLGLVFAVLYIILFSIWGISVLIENVYPNIPQEFGGPQPRCAQLDMVTAQLSEETRKAILPMNATGSNSQVVRSNRVDVFYLGSDFLIVKPFMEKRGNMSEVFEIRRSALETIIWCGS